MSRVGMPQSQEVIEESPSWMSVRPDGNGEAPGQSVELLVISLNDTLSSIRPRSARSP
jgi:hypothetical protein